MEVCPVAGNALDEHMQVFVKIPSRATVAVHVLPSDFIRTLKAKVQEREGIPDCETRLIFEGQELADNMTVSESKLAPDAYMHAVFRLRGGVNCSTCWGWLTNRVDAHPTSVTDVRDKHAATAQIAIQAAAGAAPAVQNTQMQQGGSENKIAIVGMGCRIPGATGLEEMWEMMWSGRDGTSETPAERFDVEFYHHDREQAATKKMITKRGGFVHDIYRFDAEFWRIPRDEAVAMSPAVRMLLEVAYEALSDAGLSREDVAGTRCGVFMGTTGLEWSCSQFSQQCADINKFNNTGTNACMLSNRISYEFDLKGPSYTVDTASSASLYSLYLARQSLLAGDCDMAVAGGVNTSLAPTEIIAFTAAQMLAPDGRCKSFDERADGFVKGEGAAVVILMRDRDAEQRSMPIYAAIRGGAVNHNGKTYGIQTPSAAAQELMIEEALRRSNTRPEEVGYIEAHGTGTAVGDKVETQAIGAALGTKRREAGETCPLRIGSLKSNVGHLFGGAGAAALIKLALMLHERTVLPLCSTSHVKRSPEIDWAGLHLEPATKVEEWPGDPKRPAVACLSGYGFGGANGHLVLESCDGVASRRVRTSKLSSRLQGLSSKWASSRTEEVTAGSYMLLSLSGKSAAEVDDMCLKTAVRLRAVTAGGDVPLADAVASFNKSANRHGARRTVFGTSVDDLARALEGNDETLQVKGQGTDVGGGLVLVFSGMGTQWAGMGSQLLGECAEFRATIHEVDRCLSSLGADFTLEKELREPEDKSRVNETDVAQPAIFAVQAGILAFLRAHGVEAAAVIGHSVGEIASAYAAGRLTLPDAVRVAFLRGKLLKERAGPGKMVVLTNSSLAEATALAEELDLEVAAENSPASVVLSGSATAAEAAESRASCKVLRVERAFHSKFVDDVKQPLMTGLANMQSQQLPPGGPRIVSTVTGGWMSGADAQRMATAEYWWWNTRGTVKFAEGVQELLSAGFSHFVEVSPAAHLVPHIQACAEAARHKKALTLIPTLQPPSRKKPDLADQTKALYRSLASLQSNGYRLPLKTSPAVFVPLPEYPWGGEILFEGGSFWNMVKNPMIGVGSGPDVSRHLLLGKRVKEQEWEGQMQKTEIPWCVDHALQNQVIIPGAGLIEMVLQAAQEFFECPAERVVVQDVQFKKTFNLGPDGFLPSRVVLTPQRQAADLLGGAVTKAEVLGVGFLGAERHCTATLRKLRPREEERGAGQAFSLQTETEGCEEMDQVKFYQRMNQFAQLQGAFQGIQHAWFRGGEHLVVKIVQTECMRKDYRRGYFSMHPAHLDSAVQVAGVALIIRHGTFTPMIPFSVGKFHMAVCPPPVTVFAKAVKVEMNDIGMLLSVDAYDEAGRFVFTLTDLQLKSLRPAPTLDDVMLWNKSWIPHDDAKIVPSLADDRTIAVLGDSPLADAIRLNLAPYYQTEPWEVAETVVFVAHSESLAPTSHLYDQILDIVTSFKALADAPVQFVLVTEGSQVVIPESDATLPTLAALWGLVFTSQTELNVDCMSVRLVDFPSSEDAIGVSEATELLQSVVLANDRASNEVAIRKVDGAMACFECRIQANKIGTVSVPAAAWKIEKPPMGNKRPFQLAMADTQPAAAGDVTKSLACPTHVCLASLGDDAGRLWVACSMRPLPTVSLISGDVDVCSALPDATSIRIPGADGQAAVVDAAVRVADYMEAAFVFQTAGSKLPGARVLVVVPAVWSRRTMAFLHFVIAMKEQHRPRVMHVVCDDRDGQEVATDIASLLTNSLQNEEFHQQLGAEPVDLLISLASSDATELLLDFVSSGGTCLHVCHAVGAPPVRCKANVSMHTIDAAASADDDVALLFPAASAVVDMSSKLPLIGSFGVEPASAAMSISIDDNPDEAFVVELTGDVQVPLDLTLPHLKYDKGPCWFVVVGGHKGIGLEMSKWLVAECGVRALVMVGSSPAVNDAARVWADAEAKSGANVQYKSCDVSDLQQVKDLLEGLNSSGGVAGIFHLAVVYDDKVLRSVEQTTDVSTVFGAKAEGAWNLHVACEELNITLDAFFLASSIATITGSPGQGVYVAANSYLEGLAAYRRQRGLAASVCCIGLISDAGIGDREQRLIESWEGRGLKALSSKHLLMGIGYQIGCGLWYMGVTSELRFLGEGGVSMFEDTQYLQNMVQKRHFSRMFDLVQEDGMKEYMDNMISNRSLLARLDALDPEQQVATVQETLQRVLADMVQIPVDTTSPLVDFGLDSLLSMSFVNKVGDLLEGKYRPTELQLMNSSTTIASLSQDILQNLFPSQ